jgi:hypothetical protein
MCRQQDSQPRLVIGLNRRGDSSLQGATLIKIDHP